MKINYVNKIEGKIKLEDIQIGELFRPIDSREVFMRTSLYGDSELLTTKCSTLWEYTAIGYEGEPFENKVSFEENYDYQDLIACIDIESGEIWLLFDGIYVEKLKNELTIEE